MLQIDRRYFRYFDWISFILICLLSCIGLFFVFSATYKPEIAYSLFFKKQAFGIITGIIIYFICSKADFRFLMRYGYFAYFAVLALLAFTIFKGSIGMGAQRWIDLGIIKIQPSELAKLFFPSYLVYYCYTESDALHFNLSKLMPVLITLGISFLLILKQPDLGTALIVLIAGLILLWLSGLNKLFFLIASMVVLITAPLSWHMLKEYQRKRVLVFLGQGDSHKERYQIEQSQIAIGSGGLLGKGFLRGTQNKCQFLPEGRTDFIFSVMAEEIGFLGILTVLFLFLLLFIRLLMIISGITSPFIQLLAVGLVLHIMLSTLINIAMVTGLLPIVGIPLPLISYGLCNLWITYASLGWFNSIAIRRFYWGE